MARVAGAKPLSAYANGTGGSVGPRGPGVVAPPPLPSPSPLRAGPGSQFTLSRTQSLAEVLDAAAAESSGLGGARERPKPIVWDR